MHFCVLENAIISTVQGGFEVKIKNRREPRDVTIMIHVQSTSVNKSPSEVTNRFVADPIHSIYLVQTGSHARYPHSPSPWVRISVLKT